MGTAMTAHSSRTPPTPSHSQKPCKLPLSRGMPVLLLVNPFAGRGKARRAASEVEMVFVQAGLLVDVFQSSAPGELHQRAREADFTRYCAIVVLGGDGSIHEVLNGMLVRPDGLRLPLALVPCGTGNALVSSFASAQRSAKQCAESILQGHAFSVDCAAVKAGAEEAKSFNVINWPADYAPHAEAMRWLGANRYSVAVAMDIFGGRKARRVRMLVDGEEIIDEVMLVHIQNTKTCGNQLLAAPEAQVDDGLLDMFYVRDCGKLSLLHLLTQVGSGAHVNNTNAVFRQCKQLMIEPIGGSQSLVMIDGEIRGTDPISIEVLPRAFNIIV
eukprot:GGOE01036287.1.p1 GENE.GGOE01036287.1~~GGOE01036287.1.p1  ORF type:complete len:328 (+),score=84.53 GGOE01036287.1:87-1070(+)